MPTPRWKPRPHCWRWPKSSTAPIPGATASLREALDETLICCAWVCHRTLARALRSTNTIESMISVCREHTCNVKRWRAGKMALH